MLRKTLCLCLTTLLCSLTTLAQGNTFDKIRYNGGTLQTKVKPDDWKNKLTVTSDEIKLDLKDGQSVTIDPKRVTGLSYGQEAHRRVGTMIALGILLAPSRCSVYFTKPDCIMLGLSSQHPTIRNPVYSYRPIRIIIARY